MQSDLSNNSSQIELDPEDKLKDKNWDDVKSRSIADFTPMFCIGKGM